MERMEAPEGLPKQSPERQRLTRLIEQRAGELDLDWTAVAELAGLTKEGLRGVRFGNGRMRVKTKGGLERAMRWTAGSVDRILAGGEPGIVHEASARLSPTDDALERFLARPVPTDEDLQRSGLQPETVKALMALRRRIERWAEDGDEAQIRRANRVIEAIEEEQDAG
jgi:hypothetical protein